MRLLSIGLLIQTVYCVAQCPGFHYSADIVDRFCVLQVPEMKSWDDAQAHCAKLGGELFTVLSEQDHDDLVTYMQGPPFTKDTKRYEISRFYKHWLGGRASSDRARWEWHFEYTSPAFHKIIPFDSKQTQWRYEPEYPHDNTCLAFTAGLPRGHPEPWTSGSCEMERPFVCQKRFDLADNYLDSFYMYEQY